MPQPLCPARSDSYFPNDPFVPIESIASRTVRSHEHPQKLTATNDAEEAMWRVTGHNHNRIGRTVAELPPGVIDGLIRMQHLKGGDGQVLGPYQHSQIGVKQCVPQVFVP